MVFKDVSGCLEPNVKAAMRTIIDKNLCTGNGIMLGKDGELILAEYQGFADAEKRRPIDANTVYRMFSMTKVIISVAVMQLFEKNAFRMSEPLSKYLPEYANMMIEDENGLHKAENPILIKHLLTMTAGTTYGDAYGKYEALAKRCKTDAINGNRWSTRRFARECASLPLAFEPGTRYCYSIAYDILGALVEIWSGKELPQYCRENIFRPLGINNTGFSYNDIDKANLCDSFKRIEDGSLVQQDVLGCPIIDDCLDFETATFASGGAGLLSTLGDYYKFVRILSMGGTADGVRILSKKAVEFISTPRLTEAQKKYFSTADPCSFGESFSYGCGVRVMVQPHTETFSNLGEWGWSGAMGTWMHIDPVENIFYVYVHQTFPADHVNYVPYINTAIYSSLD